MTMKMTKRSLVKSPSKVPKSWSTYIVKCIWAATAVNLVIPARNEADAIDKAEKKLRRTFGGEACKDIRIVRQTCA